MGDEEHGAAALATLPHDVEDALGQVGGQRRRDLVEDQELRVVSERASQVEHAQDRQRQVADELAEADLEIHFCKPRANGLHGRAGQPKVLRDLRSGTSAGS